MKIKRTKNIFSLETENCQYVFGAGKNGLYHLHWGKKCPAEDFEISELTEQNSNHAVLDFTKTEYVPFGGTMYRECALKCTYADGCRDTVLAFADCNIRQDGAEIVMKDDQYGLEVTLVYRLFDKSDVIERFAVIKKDRKSVV